MTDQPKTMEEYHFRKLGRTIVSSTTILCAAMFASVAGIVDTSSSASLIFAAGAVWAMLLVHAMTNEGRVRSVMNRLSRTDVCDLERPDERLQEVPADD